MYEGPSLLAKSFRRPKMRSLTIPLLLVLFFIANPLARAQAPDSADKSHDSPATGATKQEVEQLRAAVAAQQQTIEELKAMVERLAAGKYQAPNTNSAPVRPIAETGSEAANAGPTEGSSEAGAHLLNAVRVQPVAEAEAWVDQAKPAAEAKKEAPLTAGWNGEHFFIRSPDGQFNLNPYGYVDTDHRAYKGDGAPADTFVVPRARFGFQGNYGSHFDFALLTDANATSGAIVRDVYLNVRIKPEFQFQAGQYKEPFAQETGIGATNLDFVERGLQSLLYPCAGTAFRCPGITLHGDISGGVVQWWAGAFNGRNGVAPNVTNEPEFVGRLRFYPWRKSKNDWFKQFAFGGSITHSRSRGLSGDLSFNGTLPNGTYAFFPQLRINGPIERYEGEFTYIHSSFALRGEYVQLQQQRYGVGSEQVGGLAFLTLPGVGA